MAATFRCRVNGGPWETCELNISHTFDVMKLPCCETGSSGYLASNLQSGINKVEIEATATASPNIKTIGSATVNLTGQGSNNIQLQ